MTIRERKEYLETHSLRTAAAFFGVSVRTIVRWRSKLDVVPRWSRNTPVALQRTLERMDLAAIQHILSTCSDRIAAHHLGIAKSTACAWRHLFGIDHHINIRQRQILAVLQRSPKPLPTPIIAHRINLLVSNTLDGLRCLEQKGLVIRQVTSARKCLWTLRRTMDDISHEEGHYSLKDHHNG